MRRWFDIARMRLRSLLRRRRLDEELDKELQYHLERQREEYVARGMPVEYARRAAVHRLGGIENIQEECRDMRRTDFIDNVRNDLRYTLRALRRSPGFALVMVLTLALAIGANSAIFSVIRGVLLRNLPYPRQDRIVRIFLSNANFPKFPLNPFDFRDFRARNRSFGSMAIMTRSDLQLSGMGEPQRLTGFRVTAGYFRTLGLSPARGKEFTTRDELPGNERIAIISDRLWRVRFNADPNIIGRKLRLDERPFTVVGVMPPQMQHPGNEYRPVQYGDTVEVWWPFTFEGNPANRGSHYTEGVARLKPGVSIATASAEMNAIMAQLGREHPDNDTGWRVLVIPLFREIVGPSQRLLLVLFGAVGLVLLIACANAANLLLARATGRRREMAIRSALGARRSRLIEQTLTESLIVAMLGGVGAVVIAIAGVRALVALLPASFPRSGDIRIDSAVFVFTLVIALGAGIVFGLAPALQTSRTDMHNNLREGGRGASGSARQLRLRNWLVISEVALACVLLIGAGLLFRSFMNLLRSDPGFRPEHVLSAGISLPEETYKNGKAVLQFNDRLVEKLETMTSVRAGGIGSDLPWTGYDDNLGGFQIEGKQPPPHEDFHARYHGASRGYFRALGIPLVAGRDFNAGDNMKSPPVLIINRAMAQRYWPGENVIGKRIDFFEDHPKEKDWTTIVGVVGDVKDAPAKASAEPAFWWPVSQTPFGFPNTMIALRSDGDPRLLVNALRQTVHDLDPTLAVADVRLLDQIADSSMAPSRFTLFLVGLFAALAITLAAIGTYGVISYSVNQRMQEFGMRMALGAKPKDVLGLVLAQGAKLAVTGMAIGIVAGSALARVLRSLLYGVSAADPLTIVTVALIVVAVGLAACFLPARHATRVDPISALRTD